MYRLNNVDRCKTRLEFVECEVGGVKKQKVKSDSSRCSP